MSDEQPSLVEGLQAQAEDLFGQTPTLFAYEIVDAEKYPALRDVLVAAYMDPDLPPESYFHVEIRLETLLEETLTLPVVGIRILNGAPMTFRGAVLAAGRVIYSRDEKARIAFEDGVRREYLDLKGLLEFSGCPTEGGAVTIRRDAVASRLGLLEVYLNRLREIGEGPDPNPMAGAARCYSLQSAITCCLSVCLVLADALRLRPPRDFADIPEVLSEVGLLEDDLARRLRELVAVRQRLVHGSAQEDPVVGEGLSGHLTALEEFARAVRARLDT